MAIRYTLSLQELVHILMDHFGIESGEWEIGFNFDIRSIYSSQGEGVGLHTILTRVAGVNLVELPNKTPNSYSPQQKTRRSRVRSKAQAGHPQQHSVESTR
jgi:hypothetical protein